MGRLPSGTVTFLFTDIEGSTRLLRELGAERYARALHEHRRAIRVACDAHAGTEVDTQGDAFFFAFPTAPAAVDAAAAIAKALQSGPIRVRVGVHTGTPVSTDEGYVGVDVHRAARIAAAGHGGQTLVSAATAALIEPDRLLDLGEHRFKDLAVPERVFQLGHDEYPPLKSLYRSNLPVATTEFVGRRGELADVTELLGRPGARLVTLTGPGGTGKTRLALQAAVEIADHFPDGVWFVPLAPIHDPALAIPAVADVLGVAVNDADALAGRRALVVVDNAEHLLPQLADGLGWIRSVDGPTLLVTSRERLRLSGEHVWPVPPLDEEDGRGLFVARAQASDPMFRSDESVDDLCERLEQLPLALELAAATTSLFTPRQLLDRLGQRLDLLKASRDTDPRQRTLRATIDWSHDLLNDEEQRLFRRLSVFVGGCTLEAAEAICGAEPDTLLALLDKSLIRRRDVEAEPRFWMLETIREFGAERLLDSGEVEATSRAHAQHFASFSERFDAASDRPPTAALNAEVPNLRRALAWAEAAAEPHLVLRVGTGGFQDIWFRGSLPDVCETLQRAIDSVSDEELRLKGLLALAFATYREGDHTAAQAAADRAAAVARSSGDPRRLAAALDRLANLRLVAGDDAGAQRLLEEAANLAATTGDRRAKAKSAVNLGDVALFARDYERAAVLCRGAVELWKALDDAGGESTARVNLATAYLHLGRHDDAAQQAVESAQLSERVQDRYGVSCALQVIAAVAIERGDAARGASLLGAADALREDVGAALEPNEQRLHDDIDARVAELLDRASLAAAYDAGLGLGIDAVMQLLIDDQSETRLR